MFLFSIELSISQKGNISQNLIYLRGVRTMLTFCQLSMNYSYFYRSYHLYAKLYHITKIEKIKLEKMQIEAIWELLAFFV